MMRVWRMVGLGVVVSVVAVEVARADVTGDFDGTLAVKKPAQTVSASAGLSQVGTLVSGTVAVGGDPTYAGAYLVQGKATPKKLKLRGLLNGVNLSWTGKIVGDTVAGKAKLKGPGVKLAGTLGLTRNGPIGDGVSCDGVYTANQTLFTGQVLAQALTTCTTCHVAGGQAQSARLRITATDPLATARAIAPFVDATNPAASRILEKPLNVVPHGGGQQFPQGSTEAQILMQWIGLIAAAHCN